MNKPSLLKQFVVYASLTIFVFVTLYPVLWVVKMALTPSQAFSMSVNPLPTEFSLSNFKDLLFMQDMEGHWLFFHQLANSVVVAVVTTLVGVGLATTAAYAFSR
ncbi:MAG: sugar ABC transporter permease, partial [Myxococcota bacterium]